MSTIESNDVMSLKKYLSQSYQSLLIKYYQFTILPNSRILDIGCGDGDLLMAFNPAYGVGIDADPQKIQQAIEKQASKNVQFHAQAYEQLNLNEAPFDYIIISDTLSYMTDILQVLKLLQKYCHSRTRIIINSYSKLWQPLLYTLELTGLRQKQPDANWVSREDMANLLECAGFEVINKQSRILVPAGIPIISWLFNSMLATTPGFSWLCLTNIVIARSPTCLPNQTSVSVICPCRNEEGNIPEIVRRLPVFPGQSELIFVEGNSKDNTLKACQEMVTLHLDREISVYMQQGRGKGDAVRLGFSKAKYDILMILDADMTVPPEALPQFHELIVSGRAELVNGSRLVYPMENEAMRFLNLCGNKFFAWGFSWLLGQQLKDTLCGTKVLLKNDYEKLASQRTYFGEFDPFGDFDILFGAAKLSLKIKDLPVRYRARTYGTTQISRFRHGLILLWMYGYAWLKFKWF